MLLAKCKMPGNSQKRLTDDHGNPCWSVGLGPPRFDRKIIDRKMGSWKPDRLALGRVHDDGRSRPSYSTSNPGGLCLERGGARFVGENQVEIACKIIRAAEASPYCDSKPCKKTQIKQLCVAFGYRAHPKPRISLPSCRSPAARRGLACYLHGRFAVPRMGAR